ncbi:asb099 [Agrotis segetum nucleopolyhedrovirus B]|uniref:Asb099 n=1 Tax=Agrotis segetum nucleopolyhedrovirus B TaxID=1580580 RepID=A0A0A7KTG0_9ABAC|nr:asb099 [Agrotis segetum nucleopolyhedrovirus B]AIZ48656.1 asb099 [Agrotis segetum nucleopolyhedrovirus B]
MVKSWIKTVMWLLFLFALLVWVFRQNAALRDTLIPGPTCDSYYYEGRDLRRCPKNHEFNVYWQTCVPIGEDGCTASVQPTAITHDDFDCSKHRYVRDLLRPCNGIRDCRTNEIYYSDTGRCYDIVNDVATNDDGSIGNNALPQPVDCINVPGCRHFADIHFKNGENGDANIVNKM